MVRRIEHKRNKNISVKEIDNQINIGLNFIKQYCGEETYQAFYNLSVDSSTILKIALLKINEAYKISKLQNNKKRILLLPSFIESSKHLLENYLETYKPSAPMIVFSCLFILNEYLSQYVGINKFKAIIKDDSDFIKLLTTNQYQLFKNALMIREDNYNVAFNEDWNNKFNKISECISYSLIILSNYRERYFSNTKLNTYINNFIDKYEFDISDFSVGKNFQEYELIIKINKIINIINISINSEYFKKYLYQIKIYTQDIAEQDYKFLLSSINYLKKFIEEFNNLFIIG